MRAIKFRAWDGSKMWDRGVPLLRPAYNGTLTNVKDDCGELGYVKDTTLLQFTGLLDKNGKEIYEGDIIKVQVNKHVWFYNVGCDASSGTNLMAINVCDNVTIDDEADKYTYQMTKIRAGLSRPIPGGCEIIGNIYEHPDLLL